MTPGLQRGAQELLLSDLREESWNVLVAPASPMGAAPPALCHRQGLILQETQGVQNSPRSAPALDMLGWHLGKFHIVPDQIYDILLSYSCNGVEVMWGRGTETSCSSPPLPPTLNSASVLTTCIFIVSWSLMGKKKSQGKQIKASSSEKGKACP